MRRSDFTRRAKSGRVLAKAVGGNLIYAHKVSSNIYDSLNDWQEFDSLREAALSLGTALPRELDTAVIHVDYKPIDWSKFTGGYYTPVSASGERSADIKGF